MNSILHVDGIQTLNEYMYIIVMYILGTFFNSCFIIIIFFFNSYFSL